MPHSSMTTPQLNPLHRADGSATYSCNGYTVIAAVNGPIEVQRRDELSEEAAIDVAIRPASGVGGVRERHFESIIQNTLRHVIIVSAHPRTLIQITLQVITSPGDGDASGSIPQAYSNLPVLPALLQCCTLALLSTSIPLSMTLTSALLAVQPDGEISDSPSSVQLKTASSIHVFAFSSNGDLLIVESEGDFDTEIWEDVYDKASQLCHGSESSDSDSEDIDMDRGTRAKLEDVLRGVVQEKVTKDQRWKEILGWATSEGL
ncbi:exosome non-catalytic core subunit rrp46 [Lecanora helva]